MKPQELLFGSSIIAAIREKMLDEIRFALEHCSYGDVYPKILDTSKIVYLVSSVDSRESIIGIHQCTQDDFQNTVSATLTLAGSFDDGKMTITAEASGESLHYHVRLRR